MKKTSKTKKGKKKIAEDSRGDLLNNLKDNYGYCQKQEEKTKRTTKKMTKQTKTIAETNNYIILEKYERTWKKEGSTESLNATQRREKW